MSALDCFSLWVQTQSKMDGFRYRMCASVCMCLMHVCRRAVYHGIEHVAQWFTTNTNEFIFNRDTYIGTRHSTILLLQFSYYSCKRLNSTTCRKSITTWNRRFFRWIRRILLCVGKCHKKGQQTKTERCFIFMFFFVVEICMDHEFSSPYKITSI